MRQETCPLRFGEIFGHSVASQGDPSKAITITQLHHQIDAAAVRQPEIADDKIEGVLSGQSESAFHGRSGHHIMARTAKKPRQKCERLLAIFNHEETV